MIKTRNLLLIVLLATASQANAQTTLIDPNEGGRQGNAKGQKFKDVTQTVTDINPKTGTSATITTAVDTGRNALGQRFMDTTRTITQENPQAGRSSSRTLNLDITHAGSGREFIMGDVSSGKGTTDFSGVSVDHGKSVTIDFTSPKGIINTLTLDKTKGGGFTTVDSNSSGVAIAKVTPLEEESLKANGTGGHVGGGVIRTSNTRRV